jgi:uncharacterized repeat protein (TIGR04138 family)
MQEVDFDQVLDAIVRNDPRYPRDAYLFLREGLDYTQKIVTKHGREPVRHVSGQELLGGLRAFALQQFGPMALAVLEAWNVRRCEDFGELVFNMVEAGLLAKTPTDSREDFRGGYEFDDAFRKPFLPSRPRPSSPTPEPETKSS